MGGAPPVGESPPGQAPPHRPGAAREREEPTMPRDPRRANGSRRTATMRWLRAQARPCHICGMPIDYGAQAGEPRAYECDELVPVSRGGSPYDHGNVDAAHRCCNSWRGAKSMRTVERLRALVLDRLGMWSSPEDFVARAKVVARDPRAGADRCPARPTTDW